MEVFETELFEFIKNVQKRFKTISGGESQTITDEIKNNIKEESNIEKIQEISSDEIKKTQEISSDEMKADQKEIDKIKKVIKEHQIIKMTLDKDIQETLDNFETNGVRRLIHIDQDDSREDLYIIGLFDTEIRQYPNHCYTYTKDEKLYKDLKSEIHNLEYPTQKMLYEISKNIIIEIEEITNRKSFLNNIRRPIHIRLFPYDYYQDFVKPYVYFKQQMDMPIYKSNFKKLNTTILAFNNVHPYKIPFFPGYINFLSRTINYNFNELKNSLVFNPNTGYYGVIYNDKRYDFICKHDYMLKNKISMDDVIKECVARGCCKYCGEELAESDFIDVTGLPGQVRKFAFDIVSAYGGDISDDELINSIGYSISIFVISQIKKSDLKFEDRSIAITAVLTYRILQDGIKANEINGYSEEVEHSIQFYTSLVNWSMDKVKELSQTQIFKHGDIIRALLLKIVKDKNSKRHASYENDPSTKIGKTLKERNDIVTINIMLKNFILKSVFDNDTIYPKSSEVKNCLEDVLLSKKDVSEKFEYYIQVYCPTSVLHSFKGDVCEHCGYKKNHSNVKDIYNKFYNQFEMDEKIYKHDDYKFDKVKLNLIEPSEIISKITNQNIQQRICEVLNINTIQWNEMFKKSIILKDKFIAVLKSFYVTSNLEKMSMIDILKLVFNLYDKEIDKGLIFLLLSTSVNFNMGNGSKLNDNDGEEDFD